MHLLLLACAEDDDDWTDGYDTLKIISENPELFGTLGELKFFPFGTAYVETAGTDTRSGYLAFDVQRENHVVFIMETGDMRVDLAESFRDMMLGSEFIFHG